ncbi:hypothetical protein A8E95_23490 [Burkholderia cenocepacia]|nr:hypothetical protein A8E96_26050 [Burkholderia cenocepacia]ONW29376.1 hypothetical protein A8E95_23490 [Burkholderia cenocepacia]
MRPRRSGAASDRAADRMKRQVPFWSVSCAHPPSRRAPHCGGLVLDMKPILGIAAAKRCIDSARVCKGGVNAPCGAGARGRGT